MATSTTSTSVSNASNATFQAWYNEIITQLLAVGLTQTTDTGQIGATASVPGTTNTSAGYTIWKFNDTLQATAPIFLKLEFGTGSPVSQPGMWATLGTGSNGSGTLTGTVTTRAGLATQQTVGASTYTSYFMYNATQGCLGIGWKYGAASSGALNVCYAGLFVFRGVTSTGASNSDAACIITSSSTATQVTNGGPGGCMQCISYGNTTVYPTTVSNGFQHTPPLFAQQGAISPDSPLVFPTFYMAPAITMTNACGIVSSNDVAVGSTFTATLLGTTNLTYINLAGMFGAVSMWASGAPDFAMGTSATSFGFAMLWQ